MKKKWDCQLNKLKKSDISEIEFDIKTCDM